MKKISIILAFALFVSGCSIVMSGCSNTNNVTEKNAPENKNLNKDQELINRIDAIKNGLTPKEKPTGKPNNSDQQQGQENSQEIQLEDLASQYDQATIKTNLGDIIVKFYKEESPLTVNNFMNLAKKGFYNGTKFHRVIKDFIIQGGDPLSKDDDWSDDGRGGPGYYFKDEINQHKLVEGSLAMANSGADTNGSQFFIVSAESTSWLDGKHTNFGYVAEGMDIVKKIENTQTNEDDHPINNITIENIELK